MELTRDELTSLVERMGFEIEEQDAVKTTYCGDPKALGNFVYDAEFWVAKKRPTTKVATEDTEPTANKDASTSEPNK